MLKPLLQAMVVIAHASAAMLFCPPLAQQSPHSAPKFAPPDGSTVDRLGETVVDGRPMAIEHVVVPRLPADVLRHYRKALDDKATGRIVERKLAGDQILARRIGDHFVTVRVRPVADGSSDVWIMTTPMRPSAARSGLPAHLALPAGSRVLSNVETVDGGRRAYTIIATADAAVSATQDFLKRSLGDRGFTLVASDASGNDPSRRVLLFQRGIEDVMVTIADGPSGRTMVLNASAPK